jgi:hypothetical protein
MEVENIIDEELQRAVSKFPKFNSPHEGYAVLLEETDELDEAVKEFSCLQQQLWTAIKNNNFQAVKSIHKTLRIFASNIVKESIQVAAMTERFEMDLLSENKE